MTLNVYIFPTSCPCLVSTPPGEKRFSAGVEGDRRCTEDVHGAVITDVQGDFLPLTINLVFFQGQYGDHLGRGED